MGVLPISVVEEMAKNIRGKSVDERKFYESADDVPDPRELSSGKKNLMVFDDLLLQNKARVSRIMSEEDTATSIVFFSSKLFQSTTSNNQGEREFHLSVSTRLEES